MARFNVNDTIELLRLDTPIRKGEVVAGPFVVDKVDHYHVRWDWVEHEDRLFIGGPDRIDLISDLTSKKYQYQLAK